MQGTHQQHRVLVVEGEHGGRPRLVAPLPGQLLGPLYVVIEVDSIDAHPVEPCDLLDAFHALQAHNLNAGIRWYDNRDVAVTLAHQIFADATPHWPQASQRRWHQARGATVNIQNAALAGPTQHINYPRRNFVTGDNPSDRTQRGP